MSKEKQKTQFNIHELLESRDYLDKRAIISAEINSSNVSYGLIERSTKEAIKAAKKAYNKLKKDAEAFKVTRDEILTALAHSAKNEYKSNFKLIITK